MVETVTTRNSSCSHQFPSSWHDTSLSWLQCRRLCLRFSSGADNVRLTNVCINIIIIIIISVCSSFHALRIFEMDYQLPSDKLVAQATMTNTEVLYRSILDMTSVRQVQIRLLQQRGDECRLDMRWKHPKWQLSVDTWQFSDEWRQHIHIVLQNSWQCISGVRTAR